MCALAHTASVTEPIADAGPGAYRHTHTRQQPARVNQEPLMKRTIDRPTDSQLDLQPETLRDLDVHSEIAGKVAGGVGARPAGNSIHRD